MFTSIIINGLPFIVMANDKCYYKLSSEVTKRGFNV